MSFLNTTASVVVKTRLPPGATREQGVAMLHDLDFFIHCDPCLAEYELLERDAADAAAPPADRARATGPTSRYRVVDVVENVPRGVWGSHVESTYEFTAVERGLFSRVQSPLGISMETVWEVRDAADGLELVEEAQIRCSRLLIGFVKGQCESGGVKIHAKMHDRLKKEIEAEAEGRGANGSAGGAA